MKIDLQTTAATLALQNPASIPILESSGMNFYCRGNRTLSELCADAGVDADTLLRQLAEIPDAANPLPMAERPLAELVDSIRRSIHARVRSLLDECEELLRGLAEETSRAAELTADFSDFRMRVLRHLDQDEALLFPYMIATEQAAKSDARFPSLLGGTLQRNVPGILEEHERLSQDLSRLRCRFEILSRAVDSPAPQLRKLFQELQLELHRGFHLEDNLLLPRTVNLESGRRSSCSFEDRFEKAHTRRCG